MFRFNKRSVAHIDITLVFLAFLLSVFGVIAITFATFSTKSDASAPLLNQIVSSSYSMRQAFYLLISPAIVIVMTILPTGILKRRTGLFFTLSIIILMIVTATNGASGVKAWVDFFWGYTVQPSEFAKIAFILMIAKVMSKSDQPFSNRTDSIKTIAYYFLPIGAIFLQGEMGTVIVLVFIFTVLLFFAKAKFKVIAIFLAIHMVAIATYYFFTIATGSDSYRINRILAFFNTELYTQNDAYQQMQSMTAIGRGGEYGVGLFVDGSMYQLNYVPANWTDFIFSSIGEAVGFRYSVILILTYMLLILRMLYIAAFTKERFDQLVIIGIMAMFLYHVFQNIGMTIGLLPITGIPLPFVSYGGSNMITNMACIGIVLNCTRNRSIEPLHVPTNEQSNIKYYDER